jgi:hypothetical protein
MATNNSANQSSTGIQSLTSAGVFNGVTVTGTANQISVSNGDGTGGNPTPSLTSNIYVSGISFDSGTTTLSNYTTTTWTPIIDGAVSGTTTYTNQVGYYTRIGNLIFVQARITITAATGTGDATIGGLPFTVKNQSNGNSPGAIVVSASGWTWPAGRTQMIPVAQSNTTTAIIVGTGSLTTSSNLQMTNAAADFFLQLIYQI